MKLMRSGRHTAPSQVEKVAEKAGKAAPAMAVTAGALMAVPHGHAATPARHAAVAEAAVTAKTDHAVPAYAHSAAEAIIVTKPALASSAHLDAAAHSATASHNYAVRSGDTLSSIASHFYGKSGDWQWLYHVNHKTVSDPNVIYPGQVLTVPADPPANYTLPASEAPATSVERAERRVPATARGARPEQRQRPRFILGERAGHGLPRGHVDLGWHVQLQWPGVAVGAGRRLRRRGGDGGVHRHGRVRR